MKKILLATMVVMAMVSCSQDDEVINNDGPVEIKLNAGVEATIAPRAVINKGDALSGIQFVKVDGESGVFTNVSAITLTGDMAAAGTITFSSKQYYPSNGEITKILGFYPAATSLSAGVASMTITGKEDVLYAAPVSGSKSTPISDNLSFNHKLTQFKFVIKRESASTSADIAKVKVSVKDANTAFSMALADGILSDWKTTSSIEVIADATATTAGTAETEGFMLEPNLTSLTLNVSATGYTEKTVTINGTDNGKFEAGKAYTITLTFKGTEITPQGEVVEWTSGTAGGTDIE